jgi:hypothetical protein
MRIAIPQWQGRVSPVFDVAANLLLVEVDDTGEVGRQEVALTASDPARGAKECAAAMHRCAVKDRSQLIALHDHTGRVRTLYGPQAAGKYYVVDWTGRIAATGPLSDRAGMEKALRLAVDGHQKRWDEVTRPPLDY